MLKKNYLFKYIYTIMSIILEQDEIEDTMKATSKVQSNKLSQSVRDYKEYKKGKSMKYNKDLAIGKQFKIKQKVNVKKSIAKLLPGYRELKNVKSLDEKNKTNCLIKIKQIMNKNNKSKDNIKDKENVINDKGKGKIKDRDKNINHFQLIIEHQNPIQSQRKLVPIKVIKPEINHFQFQKNLNHICKVKKPKKKIVIEVRNNKFQISNTDQSQKVKLSNVMNMLTKKKIKKSSKEVFVDIRIQFDIKNHNHDDTGSLYGTTDNNWNKSFYPTNNLKLIKEKMSQMGNGAKFALDNYDRFSDDLLSMRKTIGCFNRFQFQNLSSSMRNSSHHFFNPYLEPINSEKYPVFFLPTQGKGLLLESEAKNSDYANNI